MKVQVSSPYEVLYWSYYNLTRKYLGYPIEKIATSSFTHAQLSSVKDFQFINLALKDGLVVSDEVDPSTLSRKTPYPFDEYVYALRDGLENLRVSGNNFILDLDSSLSFIKIDTNMAISSVNLVLPLVFLLEVEYGKDYSLEVRTESSVLGYNTALYFFKLAGMININYALDEQIVETLNSYLFIEESRVRGYFSHMLIDASDKQAYAKELGISKGSIVFLYERDYVAGGLSINSSSFKDKFINTVNLARVRSISKSKVVFDVFSINKSLEAHAKEFLSMSSDVQDMYSTFSEYIKNSFTKTTREIRWTALGIQYMMSNDVTFSEPYFVTTIESVHPVSLTFLGTGRKFEEIDLSIQDATYFLLKQFGVTFDEKKFISDYKVSNAQLIEDEVERSLAELLSMLDAFETNFIESARDKGI